MNVSGAVVVVTGAGSGIGAALAQRCVSAGAAAVVVSDRNEAAVTAVADAIGAEAVVTDVADEAQVQELVARTLRRHGQIDLFCANAGRLTGGGIEADNALWRDMFDVNLMSHVYAARALLPSMLATGTGHLLFTASAAGLLTAPGDAAYAVTKHAAVALAEWLSMTYSDRGIGVSVLCPLGVATPLLLEPLADGVPAARAVAASGDIISADAVADIVLAALAHEEFLILPHPEVAGYWAQKASDPKRWLAGMRRLVAAHG